MNKYNLKLKGYIFCCNSFNLIPLFKGGTEVFETTFMRDKKNCFKKDGMDLQGGQS